MSLFNNAKQEIPEGTYFTVVEKVEFGVVQDARDQIASDELRPVMAACVAHKMATNDYSEALEQADVMPAQKVAHQQRLAEETKISTKLKGEIKQELASSRQRVDALPEAVFTAVAVNLGSMEATPTEQIPVEQNVSEQLLGEDPKSKAKSQRQELRQQQKETDKQAKEFSKTQAELAKPLVEDKDIGVEAIKTRTEKLKAVTPSLVQLAKPDQEVKAAVKPDAPEDYKRQMLDKRIAIEVGVVDTTDYDQQLPLQ